MHNKQELCGQLQDNSVNATATCRKTNHRWSISICLACLTLFQGMGVKVFGNLHITLGTGHWGTDRKFYLFLPCLLNARGSSEHKWARAR